MPRANLLFQFTAPTPLSRFSNKTIGNPTRSMLFLSGEISTSVAPFSNKARESTSVDLPCAWSSRCRIQVLAVEVSPIRKRLVPRIGQPTTTDTIGAPLFANQFSTSHQLACNQGPTARWQYPKNAQHRQIRRSRYHN